MELITLILVAAILLLTVAVLIRSMKISSSAEALVRSNAENSENTGYMVDSIDENSRAVNIVSGQVTAMRDAFISQQTHMDQFGKGLREGLAGRLDVMQKTFENRMDIQTRALNDNFRLLRQENTAQIDKIRESVNEKLDKTLSSQFDKSFKGIIEQMENLSNSMGELKGITTQVGSLEKTLSGVKTRGIIGENQLKLIIADMLNPSQYDEEVSTIPGSSERVEIAIRLPDRNSDGFRYLPIDSKCHTDRYEEVVEAMESGDKEAILRARKSFRTAIREDARSIVSKYVKVPYTTPYAILFVPFEGMYSEIVSLNMLEELNRMQVSVVGPYTISAILSTVVNYWQALAIEKKSNDIEKTLMETKNAFGKFDEQLGKVRKSLASASTNLENLQTTRTRAILKALRNVSDLALEDQSQLTGNTELIPDDIEGSDDDYLEE
ncbi:MAG: DNA recombination protein RmuC [Clostridiales bacterium]|nr:DNA recombination protein RmuC [Clostridiales bacterium]